MTREHFQNNSKLRIGTRGSPLAIAQAEEARLRLMQAHNLPQVAIEIVPISTAGDRNQNRSLSTFGGKGLFTREIEEALLAGSIDIAVHSMKDIPTILPLGLEISCVLPREDARDGLVSPNYRSISEIPEGSIFGTSSIRRRAQLLYRRPDLEIVQYRGNVQTRLGKLESGSVSATMLALAGINRLGLSKNWVSEIATDDILPAIAQGTIGIESRIGDRAITELLARINDSATMSRTETEREFLMTLDGSCTSPLAGYAEIVDTELHFSGEIISPEGDECWSYSLQGSEKDAKLLGRQVAEYLKKTAGTKYFAKL